jgi:hypothetical protein
MKSRQLQALSDRLGKLETENEALKKRNVRSSGA